MLPDLLVPLADQFQAFNLFRYITFRTGGATMTALIISLMCGPAFIRWLKTHQAEGQPIRDDGPESHLITKIGTPTMGGTIILLSIIVPTLLWAKLDNIYIILMLISTLWMGAIGFVDDYIKVFKKDKKGLRGIFKVIGQIGLGIIVGATLYFHPEVTIKEQLPVVQTEQF